MLDNGSLIIGGSTEGDWSGINQGRRDFMMLSLNASNGSLLPWRWQVSDLVFIPWQVGGENAKVPTANLSVFNCCRVSMTGGNALRLRAAGVRFDGKEVRALVKKRPGDN